MKPVLRFEAGHVVMVPENFQHVEELIVRMEVHVQHEARGPKQGPRGFNLASKQDNGRTDFYFYQALFKSMFALVKIEINWLSSKFLHKDYVDKWKRSLWRQHPTGEENHPAGLFSDLKANSFSNEIPRFLTVMLQVKVIPSSATIC